MIFLNYASTLYIFYHVGDVQAGIQKEPDMVSREHK